MNIENIIIEVIAKHHTQKNACVPIFLKLGKKYDISLKKYKVSIRYITLSISIFTYRKRLEM